MGRSIFKLLISTVFFVGCAKKVDFEAENKKLYTMLRALDRGIEASQTQRLSRFITARYLALERRFDRKGSPYLHNFLVNTGFAHGGLCYHYADELYLEVLRYRKYFPDYRFHLMVSDKGDFFKEHNALAIGSIHGAAKDALIVDPWRRIGMLSVQPIAREKRYRWKHRDDRCLCKR